MPYELPAESFDSLAAARNRITRANQFRDYLIQQYRAAYDSFWQTPLTHRDRALSMADLQAVLDRSQATMIGVLTDSAAFVAFVESAYPDAFLSTGAEALLPERYKSAAYNYEITAEGTINLLSLKPEWEAQNEAVA